MGPARESDWRDGVRGSSTIPADGTPQSVAGSVRYGADDLAVFADPKTGEANPVLLYVGRFLAFKRVPLLVRAYQRARSSFERPAPLVIWGGYPGEWEGEHPVEVARTGGSEGIFFSGWRGHDDLPEGLNAADVLVAPSVDEPFGQVYLEAMACGLPVIATPTGGPLSFVNTAPGRPNGWLVDPDDEAALAGTLIEVGQRCRGAPRAGRGGLRADPRRLRLGHDRNPRRLAVRRRARQKGYVPSHVNRRR